MRSIATRRILRHATPRPSTHPQLSISTPRQLRHSSSSSSSSSTSSPPLKSNIKLKRKSKTLPLIALAAIATATAYSISSRSASPPTLNDETFTPYAITAKDPVSPTSFILTVRSQHPPQHAAYLLPRSSLWKYAQWSVEFKQPEVQIARHYTPLPPLTPRQEGDGDETLRFYIRAVGGGEMSAYISRLRVGGDVFLRGPHSGFDIMGRLGAKENVVFLAGGTGIAPGLQVARAVLDAKPTARVTLLWAVRQRNEVQQHLGSPNPPCWRRVLGLGLSREPEEIAGEIKAATGVATQLGEMKTRYGERLRVQLAVDEEAMRFSDRHLHRAIADAPPSTAVSTREGCELHDPRLLERATEYEHPEALRCGCEGKGREDGGPGKNLLIVSGPEGFVEHYAGAKVWKGGMQLQGPVGGLVARLGGRCPGWEKDWLVLKL